MTSSLRVKAALTGAALAFALAAGGASAQDISAQAAYGANKLGSGFTPDPYTVPIRVGGGTAYAYETAGDQCRGYVQSAPDYALSYSAGTLALSIGAESDTDTTLVVYGPDGVWYCDDDSGGSLNPRVTFATPQTGRYLIWVGTYSSSATPAQATLSLSERVASLQPDASPLYGSTALSGGFLPDPHVVDLQAGGEISAAEAISAECRGYISGAPSYRLTFNPGGTLPLILSAGAESDVTLIVRGPDGTWHCDDDGGEGLNAALTLADPFSGDYAIWVGTYGSGLTAPAALHVSELYSQ